jgi:diguanylate cyclase (GGDEF)-like protein
MEYFQNHYNKALAVFYIVTFLMGSMWGVSYFIFLPYVSIADQALFIVLLGGLAAGSIASMSMCLPAYYAYVVPMFIPIIAYNFYLMEFDKIILAIMYLLFVLMIFLSAQVNAHLFVKTSMLDKEKDLLIKQLTDANLKLGTLIKETRILSITDPLTGLFNRRYFDMVLRKEIIQAKRNKYELCLIFIDVDNFKSINDTYGHPCGDKFLIFVANRLKKSIHRDNDIIFRLGGDEFAIILAVSIPNIVDYFSKIQDSFNKKNKFMHVSLSMGIIGLQPTHGCNYQSIISMADSCLYRAKKEGKNRIIMEVLK